MPRNRAVIVIAVGAVVLLVAIMAVLSRGESGSTASFCNSLRSGENPLDVFDRYDPADVAAARTQLKQGVDRLRQLERAAPGEIRGDMKVLVDVAQQLVQALDPSAKNNPVPDFTSQFDRVRVASGNVTRVAFDQCAVTLDASASAAPTTTAG
ncbi:MAG: hypothetical protein QOC92_3966 [Acidimicrobiaceae bacterium]